MEAIAETESDFFARKGLQLLVDGSEPESIRNVMEVESIVLQQRDVVPSDWPESLDAYAVLLFTLTMIPATTIGRSSIVCTIDRPSPSSITPASSRFSGPTMTSGRVGIFKFSRT